MKSSETYTSLKELAIRLLKLYIESAKLTLSEKLTLLLSAALLSVITLVLSIFTLAFFSGAAIEALEMVMEPWLSYIILGSFFLLITVLILLLRKPLLVDPIARFISRLMFNATSHNDAMDNTPDTDNPTSGSSNASPHDDFQDFIQQ